MANRNLLFREHLSRLHCTHTETAVSLAESGSHCARKNGDSQDIVLDRVVAERARDRV